MTETDNDKQKIGVHRWNPNIHSRASLNVFNVGSRELSQEQNKSNYRKSLTPHKRFLNVNRKAQPALPTSKLRNVSRKKKTTEHLRMIFSEQKLDHSAGKVFTRKVVRLYVQKRKRLIASLPISGTLMNKLRRRTCC